MNQSKKIWVNNLGCAREATFLFKHICFELESGEALLVEGDNGSGKSSLLRLLSGLATPTDGEIFWEGTPIHVAPDYFENMHYIGHKNGLKQGLTVSENLRMLGQIACRELSGLDHVLALLQLQHHQHTLINQLSAGQKRRAALAKLFLFPKQLWILDEPLTALDTTIQTVFLQLLEEHLKQGGIAIISSHHALHFKSHQTHTIRLVTC